MADHVVTLIASPGSARLLKQVVADIHQSLPDADEPDCLAAGEAWQIVYRPGHDSGPPNVPGMVAQTCAPHAIDYAVQPSAHRRKHLLVADMDSTIIQQECINEIARYNGNYDQMAEITERAMLGELNFETALQQRVELLAGLTADTLGKVIAERIDLTPGARILVQTMAYNGAFSALISGGFSYFTSAIAKAAGFDVHRANELEIADGRLTGQVTGPIVGRSAKLNALIEFTAQLDIAPQSTMAVGDGANDLDMIRAAGTGVAFHAKPIVAREADVKINHCDLTALLYVQGYRQSEFVLDG